MNLHEFKERNSYKNLPRAQAPFVKPSEHSQGNESLSMHTVSFWHRQGTHSPKSDIYLDKHYF